MTDAQRKKLQALKEKSLKASPPANRTSITGSQYFSSEDKEWIWGDGIGWYHCSEKDYINDLYRQSSASKRYFKRDSMILLYDESGYVSKEELVELNLGYCSHTNRAVAKDKLVQAYSQENKPIFIHLDYAESTNYYRKCEVLDRLFHINNIVKIRPPILRYTFVSRYAIKVSHKTMFAICPQCGEVREAADIAVRADIAPEWIACSRCYNSKLEATVIREYNFDKYPNPIVAPTMVCRMVKGKLTKVADDYFRMFGVECETEIKNGAPLDRVQLAKNILGSMGRDFVVVKRDGSLDMNGHDSKYTGFEIVTAPADIETHRQRWLKLEQMEGFKYLRAWDTTTAGMHVHVSRNVLTTLQIGRILVFVNHPKNKKFIAHIAGRGCGPNGYNRVSDKKLGDGLRPDPDKYVAVNTKHKHTIEFRIFRGTVRERHIVRNIEFVDAVCSFCHPASRSLVEMGDHTKFCDFVAARRKQWPGLAEWLAVQKYIPAPRLKPGTKAPECVESELVEKGEKSR